MSRRVYKKRGGSRINVTGEEFPKAKFQGKPETWASERKRMKDWLDKKAANSFSFYTLRGRNRKLRPK